MIWNLLLRVCISAPCSSARLNQLGEYKCVHIQLKTMIQKNQLLEELEDLELYEILLSRNIHSAEGITLEELKKQYDL